MRSVRIPLRGGRAAVLALLLAIAVEVCGAAPWEGPTIFYGAAWGGAGAFANDGALSSAEFLELSVSADFLPRSALNPSLSLRWRFPVNPLDLAASRLGAGLELGLGFFEKHPFAWLSPRRTALAPQIGFAAYLPLVWPPQPEYKIKLSLLRLFAGYGYFALAPLELQFDAEFRPSGWGVELVEFVYRLDR